jgi:hypothetical protein
MEPASKKFAAISASASPSQHDADAFAAAIRNNDRRKLAKILKKFPGAVDWVLMPHSDFCIHVAVKAKNFDIIPFLQRHGADIDKPSVHGGPALVLAKGREEIARFTALGAKLHDPRWREHTPLTIAIVTGRSDDAIAFIEAGTDTSLRDSTGWTALMYACKFQRHWHPEVKGNPGQAYMAQYLLARPGIPDEELQVCLRLALEDKEAEPVTRAIGHELALRESTRETERAQRQAFIDSCNNGTAQKTAVMKPLKLSRKTL